MILKGKVVNLLPLEKPHWAIVLVMQDEWSESFTLPMGSLKMGEHVEMEIRPLKVLSAKAVAQPVPLSRPT